MTQLRVTDDQYGKLWRRMEEIARRVREGTLGFSETMTALQGVVEGTVQWIIAPFQFNKTKDGWTLLEDVPFDESQFIPDVIGFLKPGESSVNGDVMRTRARELNANLGQRHAEYLLNNQDRIPKELRGKYYLVFPGTVWRGSVGRRFIPYLVWRGGQWFLYFDWLEDDWVGHGRLVSVRK